MWALLLFALLIAVSVVRLRRGYNSGYLEFVSKDQNYYRMLAESCDRLLEMKSIPSGDELVLAGDDKRLPPLLKDLNPEMVKVARNLNVGSNHISFVMIKTGVGRSGFSILWGQAEYGGSGAPWQLSAGDEGQSRVLYTLKVSK